jgi:MarR family transcriptional regulator, organic hydroperoxide resistance regulator
VQNVDVAPPARFVRTREQELITVVMRAADALRRYFAALIEGEGLTLAQFNVLRILRRAGPDGLPTLCIRDRMVERAPAITRLVDRLVARGWVSRRRDPEDRRVVHCRITDDGLAVLERLDPIVDAAVPEALAGLPADRQSDIVEGLRTLLVTVDPEGTDF